MAHGDDLIIDNVYTWDELGESFEFDPAWLGAVGGMAPRPAQDALLLITHPGGGKAFDYDDYWDDKTGDLIYTGRGLTGDQQLQGANKQLAENTLRNFVFVAAGTRRLRFAGIADCREYSWGSGPDRDGIIRKFLRFRLRMRRDESPTQLAITTAKFFGGGESEAHKRLKQRIAADPTLVGLPADSTSSIEHRFLSPDRADIILMAPDRRIAAVEVELEGRDNTLVGAWQAAKYRTLLALQENRPLDDAQLIAILAAHSIPDDVREFCSFYGIHWFEIPVL